MEGSQRTKRRKISAKVEEHLRLLEGSMSEDLLEQQDSTPDTFYDAQDYFENLSNDLEDPVEDFFYDCDIPSDMPGYDSDSDLHGDECTVLGDDDDVDSCGLSEWATEFNIPQTALSALLKIIRKKGLDVPMDARTFMSTDRSCQVTNVAGGSYFHFGIENALISELTSLGHFNGTDTLTVMDRPYSAAPG